MAGTTTLAYRIVINCTTAIELYIRTRGRTGDAACTTATRPHKQIGHAVVLTNCTCFAYALRASDDGTEPEAKSKAEAVVSNRAIEMAKPHFAYKNLQCKLLLHTHWEQNGQD